MRRLPLVAAALGLACASPAPGANLLTLGSWNVERLGDRERGQSPKALAQHLYLSGVDVLALQEINDTSPRSPALTNDPLETALEHLNQEPGHEWRVQLVPSNSGEDSGHMVAVAWNEAKVTLVESWDLPVERTHPHMFHRAPRAFYFRAGFERTDFILVPLHLKSSRSGEKAAGEVRRLEAEALVAALPQLSLRFPQEADVVLAGDLNCASHNEPALSVLGSAGFRDLNRRDAVTYAKGDYRSPLDRIFTPLDQPEFQYSWQYVLTPSDPRGHLGRLSDHYLVKTVMRIMPDDD